MSKSQTIGRLAKSPKKFYRTVRSKLATRGWYFWMSDKTFSKNEFKIKMGQKLDLKNPKTFNQKLQWIKLNMHNPEFVDMVDKCEAKKFAAKVIGEDKIIPTLGVWNKFEEIDFAALPEQFVLKCTHDSGGLAICKDKAKFDKEKARRKIKTSLKNNFYWRYREWAYKNIKPRIIAEQYLEDGKTDDGLTDYKFFCFGGQPKLLYVSQGLRNHATASISFYDMDGNEMPFHRSDYKTMGKDFKMPENFDELKNVAEQLASAIDVPFVRIDLYSVCGKIYFSEITFYPNAGLIPFEPVEWDTKLGEWIKLPFEKEN